MEVLEDRYLLATVTNSDEEDAFDLPEPSRYATDAVLDDESISDGDRRITTPSDDR